MYTNAKYIFYNTYIDFVRQFVGKLEFYPIRIVIEKLLGRLRVDPSSPSRNLATCAATTRRICILFCTSTRSLNDF